MKSKKRIDSDRNLPFFPPFAVRSRGGLSFGRRAEFFQPERLSDFKTQNKRSGIPLLCASFSELLFPVIESSYVQQAENEPIVQAHCVCYIL
ncbi:hypothetical protein CDO73_14175 [Saccharibacillus sp. O23]|nr:hypothetical protein CDO73_14175 [Saccharibacillus sp. O23]